MKKTILFNLGLFFLISLSTYPARSGELLSCGEPETVTAGTPEDTSYCDIYQRQIAYRSTVETLRISLDDRRKTYEETHLQALEGYRKSMEKLYKEESKAFQKALKEEDEAQSKKKYKPKSITQKMTARTKEKEVKIASDHTTKSDPAPKIVERENPGKIGEQTPTKVITSSDAPDF